MRIECKKVKIIYDGLLILQDEGKSTIDKLQEFYEHLLKDQYTLCQLKHYNGLKIALYIGAVIASVVLLALSAEFLGGLFAIAMLSYTLMLALSALTIYMKQPTTCKLFDMSKNIYDTIDFEDIRNSNNSMNDKIVI